jgi:predicted phosphodiesterase
VKLALISDIHANLQALQATLEDIAAQSVDRIVCLGDIVGYNTNPRECIALVRDADCLCVAGNHDRAVSRQITTETFSNTAARAAAWTRQRLTSDDLAFLATLPLKAEIEAELLAVHGALHPETGCETARLDNDESRGFSFEALMTHPSGARICAFGHTHHVAVHEFRNGRIVPRPEEEVRLRDDAYYLINPGTVGEPRAADRRASYMVLDLARRIVTVRRVAYDAFTPFAATRKAGLAPPLSFLPGPVRQALKTGLRALRLEDVVRNKLESRTRTSFRA